MLISVDNINQKYRAQVNTVTDIRTVEDVGST